MSDDPNRYDYHVEIQTPGVGSATTTSMTDDEKRQAARRELERRARGFGFGAVLNQENGIYEHSH